MATPQSVSFQLSDRTIKCADCGKDFPFTVRDQIRFMANDFQDPKRCKPCREERKRQRTQMHGNGRGGRR